ncbi:MAG TPA: DUF2169 domain-containing protein [Burkholderiaceae bacterium]|nr:DUF2169 domain-containing protein [Burkholderiaceae bacterium]
MKFTNASAGEAGWTVGFAADGREQVVAIAKLCFTLPAQGAMPQLAATQVSLTQEDEFTGVPGQSATRYETDYAHRKPMCDVLLQGSAYAPAGRRVTRLPVGLKLGPMTKRFDVVGNRRWTRSVVGAMPSEIEPFERMPIGYDCAFGGTDRTLEERRQTETFLANPVGQGFGRHAEHYLGKPLPNTEEPGQGVDSPSGTYRPMAFGPIGRHWTPRLNYAGTYDQTWLEEQAPLWPADFDDRYFQSAPPDQTIPYPSGGEEVLLLNLTPDGRRSFRLPTQVMPVHFIPHRGRDVTIAAHLDTVLIEPDLDRFCLTWRAVLGMPKSVFDLRELIVGEMPPAWQRARRFPGKTYYRNLAELVESRLRRSP